MAVVPGKKRPSPAAKRMRAAGKAMSKAASATKHSMTETLCKQCDPPQWVRRMDFENHRSNFHRPLGYMYERRKQREQAIAEAAKTQEKAAADAAKAAKTAPQRPTERPKNTTKESPVASNGNGQAWTSTLSHKNGSKSGESGNQAAGATTSMTEGIVEMFRTWAIQTPPSIPASRVDAQAAADMWRGISDALRARARAEQENNKLSAQLTEPLEQAAQVASQIGDQHMEVVRRVESRYGETAEILSRPDTPDHTYLSQGR